MGITQAQKYEILEHKLLNGGRIGRDFEEMSRNFNEIGTRNPQ